MIIITGMKDIGMNKKQIMAKGDAQDWQCSFCKKYIKEGYLCENTQFSEHQLFLCNDCQNTYDMTKCEHDKEHTHRHIKIYKEDE